MNIEMNETYARDTSTVWEHEIISSASDLKEWSIKKDLEKRNITLILEKNGCTI